MAAPEVSGTPLDKKAVDRLREQLYKVRTELHTVTTEMETLEKIHQKQKTASNSSSSGLSYWKTQREFAESKLSALEDKKERVLAQLEAEIERQKAWLLQCEENIESRLDPNTKPSTAKYLRLAEQKEKLQTALRPLELNDSCIKQVGYERYVWEVPDNHPFAPPPSVKDIPEPAPRKRPPKMAKKAAAPVAAEVPKPPPSAPAEDDGEVAERNSVVTSVASEPSAPAAPAYNPETDEPKTEEEFKLWQAVRAKAQLERLRAEAEKYGMGADQLKSIDANLAEANATLEDKPKVICNTKKVVKVVKKATVLGK